MTDETDEATILRLSLFTLHSSPFYGGGRVLDGGLAAIAEVGVAALDVLDHPFDLLRLKLDLFRPLLDLDGLLPAGTGEEDVIGECRLHEGAGHLHAGML